MKFCGNFEKDTVHNMLYLDDYSHGNVLHKERFVGSILMDLPKSRNCLPHDFQLAKLQVCGFSKDIVKLLIRYLKNRLFVKTRIENRGT